MHRYPGTRPFQQSDAHLFNGRKQEIKDLCHLIIVEKLVILFAKSGIGKTSLLNAGVVPHLRADSKPYFPIFIRFNDTTQTPEQQTRYFLQAHLKSDKNHDTLWELCKYLQPTAGTSNQHENTCLLIFDQFEELFTLYQSHQIANFVSQFADLVSGRIPDSVQQQIRADLQQNPNISDADITWRETPPNVKIVIAIRSDHLSFLDQLSTAIPAILRNRFQLYPLSAEQAQTAIVQPALAIGDYESPVFSYSPTALKQLQGSLVNAQNEVESFQLQLVCQFIEDKIIAADQTGICITEVQPDLYGGESGLQTILNDFYINILDKLQPDDRPRVQRLVEQELIKNERRISLAQEMITIDLQIPIALLIQLTDTRLLRKEPRLGSSYYELSHDALIKPILITYRERKMLEDQQREIVARKEAERKQAELNEQLEAEERRRRFLAILSTFAIVASVLAAAFAAYAQFQSRKAHISQQKAIQTASRNLAIQAETQLTLNATQAIRLAEYAYRYDSSSAVGTATVLKAYFNQAYLYKQDYRFAPFYQTLPFDSLIAHNNKGYCLYSQTIDQQTTIQYYSPDQQLLWSQKGQSHLAAIDDNGEKVAFLSTPTTLVVYNQTGKKIGSLPPQQGKITAIYWLQNEEGLITDAENDSVKWYNHEGKLVHNFGKVSLLNVSPKGNYAATFGEKTYLTDLRTRKTMALDRFMNKGVFSSNGEYFAGINTTDEQHFYGYLYQTSNNKRISTLSGAHSELLSDIAFSPDNIHLAIASFDGTVSLWNNKGERINLLKGHTGRVQQVVFSPDSSFIATGADDQTIRLWKIAYDPSLNAVAVLNGHNNPTTQLYFHAAGNQLLSQSKDALLLWQLNDQHLQRQKFPKTISAVAFSNNNQMAVACWDNKVYLLHDNGSQALPPLESPNTPTALLFLPNSSLLWIGYDNGTMTAWNTNNGTIEHQLLVKDHDFVQQLCLVNPTTWLSVAGKTIELWDINGKKVAQYSHKNAIKAITSSTVTQQIAFADNLDICYVLNKNLQLIQQDTLPIKSVSHLAYNPKGNCLLASSKNGGISLLSGNKTAQKHDYSLDISGGIWLNNQVALVTYGKGKIGLWSADSESFGELKMAEQQDDLQNCAISPDRQWVAFGSTQGWLSWAKVSPSAIFEQLKQQKIHQLSNTKKIHYGIAE